MRCNIYTTSHLPREWRCDATDGIIIRVVALPAAEAALVESAKQQADDIYCALTELAGHPVGRAKSAVARGFQVPTDPIEATQPARTVLVYYDATSESPSNRLAAYTRVVYDSEHIIISPIGVSLTLTEDEQHHVLNATVLATEELALEMAQKGVHAHPGYPLIVSRGQIGASDYLKTLYEQHGYLTANTDRIEMTALLQKLGSADAPVEPCGVEGVEIRPLDLADDDLVAVYDVVKDAFAPNPPSFEAWKRHYALQPRFAPDLSAVAWQGSKPVAVSLIEFIVDGEGGGEEEVSKVFDADSTFSDHVRRESLTQPLTFADDYEARKQKIRASAKVGYVCGIATLPALRGKHLAQTLLRHNFRAAARAGLGSIFLGTERSNPAVRAYARAGMVETKVENNGMDTAKFVSASLSTRRV